MTGTMQSTALDEADAALLENIRAKLVKLKDLTRLGAPGIRQLRATLQRDIREIDVQLARVDLDRQAKRGGGVQ